MLVLAKLGLVVDPAAERSWLGPGVGADDVLAAAVCAVTARRVAEGTAFSLPEREQEPIRAGVQRTETGARS